MYRVKLEEKLGVPLPPPNQELPEEVEVQLSRLIADAGKQLTQSNQAQAAQQQAQQQAQDPLFQLQQQEVQAKMMDIQRKAQKDQADIALAQEKQQATERIANDRLQLEAVRLAAEAARPKG
jgi:hypothetical protein